MCVFEKIFTFRREVSKLNFYKLVYFCKNISIVMRQCKKYILFNENQ